MNFETKKNPFLYKSSRENIRKVRNDPSRGWDPQPEDLTGAASGRRALTYKDQAALFREVTRRLVGSPLKPDMPHRSDEQALPEVLPEIEQEPTQTEQLPASSKPSVKCGAKPGTDKAKELTDRLHGAAQTGGYIPQMPLRGVKDRTAKKSSAAASQPLPRPIVALPVFPLRDAWLKEVRNVFASTPDFPAERVEICIRILTDAVDHPLPSLDLGEMTAALQITSQMEAFAKWRSTVSPPLSQLTLPSGHFAIPAYIIHFSRLEELHVPDFKDSAHTDYYEQFRVRLGPTSQIRKLVIGCLNDADLDSKKTSLNLEYVRSLPVVVIVPSSRIDEDAVYTVTARREFELGLIASCKSVTLLPLSASAQVRNFSDRCAQVAESVETEPLRSQVQSATKKIQNALHWKPGILDLSECPAQAVQFVVDSGLSGEFAQARRAARCLHLELNNNKVTAAKRGPLTVEPLQLKLPPGLEDPDACTRKFTAMPS